MKLFARYNRVNLALTAALLVLSGLAYNYVVNSILVRELDEQLDNYKEKIESFAKKTGQLPEQGVLEDLNVSYESSNQVFPLQYSMSSQYDSDEHHTEAVRRLVYSQKAGSTMYKVTIAKPLEGVQLLTNTIVYSTLFILAIVILVSLLVNHFVLKRLWQPFYSSMDVIKDFKLQGKTHPVLPKTKIEEFEFMNRNLDQMIESAQTDYRLLKEFTENASHEMQTPLAIIRSKLDLLIQEESLTEKQGEILDGAYAAIKRMSRLNQSLLLLTKIENNQFDNAEIIDLKAELTSKLEQFREFWQDNDISVTANISDSHIRGNKEVTDILLNNLLANAAIHNKNGGEVVVNLEATQLIVSNTGAMQPLDEKRLFLRFYKGSQTSQHNGLGLSIVKQICDQAGIRISYSFGGGLHVFRLIWPG